MAEKPIWEGTIDGYMFRVTRVGLVERTVGIRGWIEMYPDDGWHNDVLRRMALDMSAERDALRERLAKLEALGTRMLDYLKTDNWQECGCVECAMARELCALLPEAKGASAP